MNRLIVTVGLPRSGKTTWALTQDYPIVCPDAISLLSYGHRFWSPGEKMILDTAWRMVCALFAAGHENVIVDACNHTDERRRFWTPLALPSFPTWAVVFKLFDTPVETCLVRAADDHVLRDVIRSKATKLEWPTEAIIP